MAEEFQESEVIFQESVSFPDTAVEAEDNFSARSPEPRNGELRRKTAADGMEANSLPVNIPSGLSSSRTAWFRCVDAGGDEGEVVPPHVIIGRRIAGKVTAFSVCTGYGRTLKGRDLSEVRNSILRMTGFLET